MVNFWPVCWFSEEISANSLNQSDKQTSNDVIHEANNTVKH